MRGTHEPVNDVYHVLVSCVILEKERMRTKGIPNYYVCIHRLKMKSDVYSDL